MNPAIPASCASRLVRIGLGSCLLLAISLTVAHSQQFQFPNDKMKEMKKSEAMPWQKAQMMIAKLPVEPGAVDVAFTDGSNLKMLLREEQLTLDTPHGKLRIAVTDIQRIEFATRVSEEDDKRIQAAVIDLGSAEFSKREAASTELLKLREKGYPAILRAAESKDLEVARRARELIEQLTAIVHPEQLVVRPKDVVYTADSMIAGRIDAVSFKAHTSQFGSVQLKLADARSLRSQSLESEVNSMYQRGWGGPRNYSSPMPKGMGSDAFRPALQKGNFKGMQPPGGAGIPVQNGKGGKGK